jgi:hypothetical protein
MRIHRIKKFSRGTSILITDQFSFPSLQMIIASLCLVFFMLKKEIGKGFD